MASTISSMWDKFASDTLPADAPAVQVQEMRRAFFAGTWCLLTEMRREIGRDDVSEDAVVNQLEAWDLECRVFYRMVKKGER